MQSERLQPPERIGPYRILERLGAGGMGEVFLAYDDRLDRRVAIKRVHPEGGARTGRRERFRREARMAARLSHPAIVQVHDILQEDEADSIVMEYVEGKSLREKVDQGPLGIRQVLELARELADGLDAAHRQGIIHRDLKTENVLVTPSGRPKIADFGIAKRFLDRDGEESLTADHAVLGTCRSMSPEQARGEPVDHRTDLFSLGVLLYEALTGRSPFAAENALATLNRVVHHRQAPVRDLVPAIPAELSGLIDHLLAKDPLLRPATAGQVRKDLDRLALAVTDSEGSETFLDLPPAFASKASTAPPPRAPEERPAPDPALTGIVPLRRHKIGIFLVLVLLAGLGIWAYGSLRPPKPPLYVAVLAPEIGIGAGNAEVELLASGARVALLQGLTALEGISPQAFEEVDAVSGSPREVAKAVAADELVGTRLDCRSEVCRIALTRRRGSDGSVAWADSFEVPTDDFTVMAGVMRQQIRRGYSGHDLRLGASDSTVAPNDLNELLRLRRRFEERREPSQESILADLQALRNRAPEFLETYLLETRVLRRRYWASRDSKDFDHALQLVQRARSLAPYDPRPLFELVDLAIEGGKLELAESSLDELDRLVPVDARLLELRARLLSAQGQGARALEMMREAARLQPSGKRLHALAQMEYVNGEVAAARQTVKRLFERSPENVDGLSLLASIELSNGNLNRAVELYGELVRISPGPAELSNLALAHLFLGRYDKAAEIFHRLFETQPNNPSFALNLADAYLLLGRMAEADKLYRHVVERIETDPSFAGPQYLTVKAQALAHLGQGRQAVAALQEALRLAPDQGFVAFEASLVYTLLGEDDSALVNAEKAMRQGVEKRWFSLPWFNSLRERSDFQELLEQARPGLG